MYAIVHVYNAAAVVPINKNNKQGHNSALINSFISQILVNKMMGMLRKSSKIYANFCVLEQAYINTHTHTHSHLCIGIS